MNDMTKAITPKSDQLNSDDLIAGPITIKIADVTIRGGQEQPVSIHYEGDNGKPYKPCKSMSRVLVANWGADAKRYIGRSLSLYREPTVKWAGLEVGGIRISHMSDIDSAMTMALTATKGTRKPFTVKPLVAAKEPAPRPAPLSQPVSLSDATQGEGAGLITWEQENSLADLLLEKKIAKEAFLKWLNLPSLASLKAERYQGACEWIEKQKSNRPERAAQ